MKYLIGILFGFFSWTSVYAQTQNLNFIFSSGPASGSAVILHLYDNCLRTQNVTPLKEYKPGAEGLVAVKALQNAKDTTNTTNVLVGNFGLNVLSKFQDVDLLKDINPITYVNSFPLVIVSKKGKYNTIEDVIAESKKRTLNVGSPSTSGTYILTTLMTGLNAPHQLVRYKNSSSGLVDIVNGSLDVFIDTYVGSKGLIDQGEITIITSTFDADTAKQLNHAPISKYNRNLGDMKLGLILSVKPEASAESRKAIINAFNSCGKDVYIVEELKKRNSTPVFMSTDKIVEMIKFVNGK